MGLESVEFMLDVEKTFDVRIEESEINRDQTVAEFSTLVFKKQKSPTKYPALNQVQTEIIRLLVENAPPPLQKSREIIGPDTRIFRIFADR